jgi:hypothetical protein
MAGVVALTGLLAAEMGGRRWAVLIAGLAAAITPIYLVSGGMLSTIPLDHLVWAATAYCVLRLVKDGDRLWWLAIGLLIGIGLETKHNAAFLAAGVGVGALLTQVRSDLKTPYPWLGALVALAVALPHLLWQASHDWPTLEFAANASGGKNALGGPIELVAFQVLTMHPATAPLWLAGLWSLLFGTGKPYRALALIWLTPFLIFLIMGGSRPDYLTPAYPALLAAGAVAAERRHFYDAVAPRVLATVVLLGLGAATLPLGLTVLSPAQMESYTRAIGLAETELEEGKSASLPQYYADRFGWQEMARSLGEVYAALPEGERQAARIVTANYGEAGAVDFFGAAYALPPALSGHNNYYLWSREQPAPEPAIVIGYSREEVAALYEDVQDAANFDCERCTSEEDGLVIYVARGARLSGDEFWQRLKHFD